MYQNISEQRLADELVKACELELKAKYPEIDINREGITKVNGIAKDAIVPKLSSNKVSPVIYVEEYVDAVSKQKLSFEDAVNKMCDTFEKHKNDVELPNISIDDARDSLFVVAVNKESNAEMLANTPHRDLAGDVTMIMRYRMNGTPDARASFLVKDDMLANLGLTKDEAFDLAIANTLNDGYRVKSIADTLQGMGIPEELLADMDLPIQVISNQDAIEGAIGPFVSKELRQEIFDSVGCDDGYYIIPSSRHEVLAVSSALGSPEDIQELVKHVNATELRPEDILSDNVFRVDSELRLSCCTDVLDDAFAEADVLTSRSACI